MVVDPWGDILLEFGEDEGQDYVDIDLGQVDEVRRRIPVLQDRKPGLLFFG